MNKWLLLAVSAMAFVCSFVLVSASFEDASLTQTLVQIARDPARLWTPGLEGATVAHLFAMLDAGAVTAVAAYVLSSANLERNQASDHPADANRILLRTGEGLRALMLGQIVFIAGALSILAVSFWSEAAAHGGADNKAGLFATALAIVIAGLGTRFLWLAGRTEILLLHRLASRSWISLLLWSCAGVFAAALFLTFAGQLAQEANELVAYLLLFGVPLLLASYVLSEAALGLMRLFSSRRSAL
ncbi:MAG TPA: hypothetical protein VJQ52_15155 [Steroidobacteraceae bacterium]|nr:hypothetical protein [Steroidobacteraceae bacterium]